MPSCSGVVLTQNEPGKPVQNPLQTVAASVEFWIRKKLDPIPPSPGECNAVQPEGLCSWSSSGPHLYFRARGWVQARFHHLPPSPGAGRTPATVSSQSQTWGPRCAPIHWQTQGSPISPDFATQHRGIPDCVVFLFGWVLLLVVPLKPPNA